MKMFIKRLFNLRKYTQVVFLLGIFFYGFDNMGRNPRIYNRNINNIPRRLHPIVQVPNQNEAILAILIAFALARNNHLPAAPEIVEIPVIYNQNHIDLPQANANLALVPFANNWGNKHGIPLSPSVKPALDSVIQKMNSNAITDESNLNKTVESIFLADYQLISSFLNEHQPYHHPDIINDLKKNFLIKWHPDKAKQKGLSDIVLKSFISTFDDLCMAPEENITAFQAFKTCCSAMTNKNIWLRSLEIIDPTNLTKTSEIFGGYMLGQQLGYKFWQRCNNSQPNPEDIKLIEKLYVTHKEKLQTLIPHMTEEQKNRCKKFFI